MKLHFDSNQEYQIEAIKSVTDLFEGQTLNGGDFEFSLNTAGALISENGFGNKIDFARLDQLVENIQRVQKIVKTLKQSDKFIYPWFQDDTK